MSTVSKQSARAVADLSEGTILATVEIAAAADRVFRALTDANEIPRWWGSPDTYRTEEWSADLRVGGGWRARGRMADGRSFSVEGEYLELDPPRKLVKTWKPDWDEGRQTTVTYRIDPIPGGSRVTVRHSGFGERQESCKGHAEGWERVLGFLEKHLSTRSYFLCKLLPPRPTFQQDMSLSERKLMGEHVAYWTEFAKRGVAVVFGPVLDPEGGWGLGILRVADPAELAGFQQNDPTIRSGLGFKYQTFPIASLVIGSELRKREP